MLTAEQIDREIASRADEVAAMSATLVELDNHPGLEHVRRFAPTGATALRWADVEQSLTQLWDDLGRMTTILDAARAVRARGGTRLDDAERRELTRLLRERSHEVSRQRIPLAQRTLAGPGESVEYAGLADTADRMRAAYPPVIEFLDAVVTINTLVAARLAPAQERLDAAGATGPKEIAELLTLSATDPLALTGEEVERRASAIAREIDERSAELAEHAALLADWPDELARTRVRCDELRDATRRATQTRARAEEVVLTAPLPVRTDPEPQLRAELDGLTAANPLALQALRHRISAALDAALEDEQLAQGLLDRRTELKGRLTAYQAKAARLGLGEDRDLMASGQIASGLLSRRPCDLRAVTRAIKDYQQILDEKRGKPR